MKGLVVWSRRAWLPVLLDAMAIALAWLAAFLFRFSLLRNNAPQDVAQIFAVTLPVAVLAWAASLAGFGVYSTAWRHAGIADVGRLARACAVAALGLAAVLLILRVPNFPRSIVLIHPVLATGALLALRLGARLRGERSSRADDTARGLLVLGSVDDAAAALHSLRPVREWRALAVYSPLPRDAGARLQGLPVLAPPRTLDDVAKSFGVQHALVASPAGSTTRR
ncbi:MAG: polysaccharide biosynthesis protein, partial [Betaproteobacteria bacterium]|nr:polysaccharide biosynthesis protein [Betaproteobacteria bacterium]